jgi:hypothetical protein
MKWHGSGVINDKEKTMVDRSVSRFFGLGLNPGAPDGVFLAPRGDGQGRPAGRRAVFRAHGALWRSVNNVPAFSFWLNVRNGSAAEVAWLPLIPRRELRIPHQKKPCQARTLKTYRKH